MLAAPKVKEETENEVGVMQTTKALGTKEEVEREGGDINEKETLPTAVEQGTGEQSESVMVDQEKDSKKDQHDDANDANVEQKVDGWKLFELGKLAVKEHRYEEAIDFYSRVLETLVPKLGQFAKELGPVYLAYGRALIQVGLDTKDDGFLNTGAMSESMIEGLAASASSGANGSDAKKPKIVNLDNVTFEGDDEVEKASVDNSDNDNEEDGEGEEDEEDDGDDDGEDGNEQNAEENAEQNAGGDEFELAWEILDIARIIFNDSASMDDESKRMLGDVYCELGDVAMETEVFKQAADEYFKSLEIKKSLKCTSQRDLAAIYFKFGVALEYDNRPREAVEPLEKAKQILQKCLDTLLNAENNDDDKGKEKIVANKDENMDANKEADELMQLLPEIKNKLEDLKTQIANGEFTIGAESIKNAVNDAAINSIQDLTGLVKKRKAATTEDD